MDNIISSVKTLLSKYQYNSYKSAPINIFNIIEKENIKLSFEELDDGWSGFCVRNAQGSQVVLNDEHHINRKRFTAAHELGHLINHCNHGRDEDVFVDKTVAYNRDSASATGEIQKEIEANRFAAEILMPEDFIREELEGKESLVYEDVEELAKKYQVSERAMTIRIEKLTGITFFI